MWMKNCLSQRSNFFPEQNAQWTHRIGNGSQRSTCLVWWDDAEGTKWMAKRGQMAETTRPFDEATKKFPKDNASIFRFVVNPHDRTRIPFSISRTWQEYKRPAICHNDFVILFLAFGDGQVGNLQIFAIFSSSVICICSYCSSTMLGRNYQTNRGNICTKLYTKWSNGSYVLTLCLSWLLEWL